MTTIKLKNGSGAPAGGDLVQGEPALDLTNKRLYTENASGTVIEVGTNPTSVTTGVVTATSLDISGNIDVDGTTNLDVVDIDGAVDFASTTAHAGNASFADNAKAIFGAGSDLQIYHDGSNSYISDQGTNDLKVLATDFQLKNAADNEFMMTAVTDGAVTAYHNGSAKLTTTSTGIDVTGTVVADGIESSGNFAFTAADGMQISAKETVGINIDSDDNDSSRAFTVTSGSSSSLENLIIASEDAGVTLYHNNATKLATTSTGIDVTGTVTADGLVVEPTSATGLTYAADGTNSYINFEANSISDSVQLYAGQSSGGYFSIGTKNSGGTLAERMRIDSSGSVGIGTSSPSAEVPLTAFYSSTSQFHFGGVQAGISNNTYFNGSAWVNRNASVGGSILQMSTSGEFNFRRAGTGANPTVSYSMTLDSSGNVGIGTSSPNALLHIGGIAEAQGSQASPAFQIGSTTGYRLGMYTDAEGGYIENKNGDNGLIFKVKTVGEAMRIDGGTGNVGIGTSSPDGKLHLSGTGSAPAKLIWERSDGGVGSKNWTAYIDNTHDLLFGKTNDSGTLTHDYLHIQDDGNVGIGTSSPDAPLHVEGTSGTQLVVEASSGNFAQMDFKIGGTQKGAIWTYEAEDLMGFFAPSGWGQNFYTNGTEAMRIDSSGNLLVGRTSVGTTGTGHSIRGGDSAVFARAGGEVLIIARNTNNGQAVRFDCQGTNGVGSIDVTTSATTYNTSSDQRLKDNIVDAPSASDDIDAIQVRSFDWKADGSHQKYGMVAQELQGVAPEAVSEGATEEDMMGVDYSKLVPMMLKEIQSLRARVAQLEGAN